MTTTCQQNGIQEPSDIPKRNIDQSVASTYGVTRSDASQHHSRAILDAIRKSGSTFKRFEGQIMENSMKIFERKNEGVVVAMMQFDTTPEKIYGVKGTFIQGQFVPDTELLIGRKRVDQNNGQIVIVKGQEALLVEVRNGIETISPLSEQEAKGTFLQVKDCAGNHGGTGFCQREPNESFADCYKAEKDEFCDDLFSCLAVDTQLWIMLLIAAACQCSATQC